MVRYSVSWAEVGIVKSSVATGPPSVTAATYWVSSYGGGGLVKIKKSRTNTHTTNTPKHALSIGYLQQRPQRHLKHRQPLSTMQPVFLLPGVQVKAVRNRGGIVVWP